MLTKKHRDFNKLLSYYKLKRDNFKYLSKVEIIELHDIAAVIKGNYDNSDTIGKINIFNIIGNDLLEEIEMMFKNNIIVVENDVYKCNDDTVYTHPILEIPITTLN